MRWLLKEDLGCKALRQLTAQRAKPVNAQRRLGICRARKSQIESGEIGPMAIYWGGGEFPRLGECEENSQHVAIWAKQELGKADIPNSLILREQGRWQGGRCAMVSPGLIYRGKGALRFAPNGAKINESAYAGMVGTKDLPDCRHLCGAPHLCAPARRSQNSHIQFDACIHRLEVP